MKKTLSIVIILAIGIGIGILIDGWVVAPPLPDVAAPSGAERTILYWKAPMDPDYRRDEPGKSPMGMDLVPVYATVANDAENIVHINPQVVNNLGVRTAPAELGSLSRLIDTVGYVGYDEDTLQHIHMRVDGWIESLAITASGDPVTAGQTLLELYSPTLVNAQEEFLTALRSSNSNLQKASHDRLVALGVPVSDINRLRSSAQVKQRLTVIAQNDGVVANLLVREGEYITPATEVMSIAKLDRVWVLAEVFERQAAWIKPGQLAEVELEYLPGHRLRGSVDYIYPELDLKTRTLKVRMRFDNQSEILRPNMFARVTIHGTETPDVVHIPRAALIRGGAADRVILSLGEGRFKARPVRVGIESGARVEIRSGIGAGDLVVTSGQFLIDSESNIESALARMGGASPIEPETQSGVGAIVRGIDSERQKLTLQHDSIEDWAWPEMVMDFAVADERLMTGLDVGESIEITIEKRSGDDYVITAIATATDKDSALPHDGQDMDAMQ